VRRGAGAALAAALAAASAGAAEWRVPSAETPSLVHALALAADGDTVRVQGGVHRGPLRVERSVRLLGEEEPVLDGGGRGTVVTLAAAGSELAGFRVRGSGRLLEHDDAGIAVAAPHAVVRDNRLEEVLFGIDLRAAPGSRVAGNTIEGLDLALGRRGDAIRVWESDGTAIVGNVVSGARDVVLWYSSDLVVRHNRISGGRYALHFMYCDDAEVSGNLLADNSVGAYLMYSRRLRLTGNTLAGNAGPSGYGIGLKDMEDVEVAGNVLAGNRVGLFLDNSPLGGQGSGLLEGNLLVANRVGALLLPNVSGSRWIGNDFVDNSEQVALAGAGGLAASNLWESNFWSDYAGYDADGDGIGELPHRADRLFERLADRHPELRLFAGTPAAAALDFAARALPIVRPQPKLEDAAPRLAAHPRPPAPPLPASAEPAWAPAAGGLLALGLFVLAAPRLRSAGARAAAEPAIGPGPAVEARDLTVRFRGQPALDGVSFGIAPGEAVALWGGNGAGKTTALRALLGLVAAEGTVVVSGLDPRRRGKEVRRGIGFVPQEVALPGEPTVEETFDFFARLRRVPRRRVEELIEWLALRGHRGKRVRELSGGLRQRLALGLALLADPPLLLLDEPTANLDREARRLFHDLLGELKARGKTLVFTSHRATEVAALADRVLHLEEGKLAAAGAPAHVLRSALEDGDA
jgi:nitrous oxidase accessory protein